MRLASNAALKLPQDAANDYDPREDMDGEVVDLSTRSALPAVAQKKGVSDGLMLMAGVGVVALLGAVAFWSMDSTRQANEQAASAPQDSGATGQSAAADKPIVVPPADASATTTVDKGYVPGAVARSDPAPQAVLAASPRSYVGPAPNPGPQINPYDSPTVIFDAGGAPVATLPTEAITGAAQSQPGNNGVGGSAGDFASRIGGVGGGPAKAATTFDPQTTVTQGTLIPAILETAIDTDTPGFVRAVVSQDVRSYDGRRVLIPRSSRLIGQYQSGLQAGQKRAYVIWTRLIRPDGVSVDIASPATGFDGSGGLPGKVSGNGFFQRFGSAMLLSVVGGLGGLVTGGAAPVVLGGAGQSAAAAAAQQDGQKGPTVRVRQGEPIRVFTARDLDFSSVAQ